MASSPFESSAEKIGTEAKTAPLTDLGPPFMAALRRGAADLSYLRFRSLMRWRRRRSFSLLNRPGPTGSLPDGFVLPYLRRVVPQGFDYGANYLVEFDAPSLWYETSLTIAADALKSGIRTDYHTFTHSPHDIRSAL